MHIDRRKTDHPNDIMRLEADTNYSFLYLHDGKTIYVATTLKNSRKGLMNVKISFRYIG